MLQITYTPRFEKHFKNLSNGEKAVFRQKLHLFAENPLHPSLRTKRVQGTHNPDLFEFSVNMDIRVIWYYEDRSLVALIDIGHHDILRNN